MIDIIIKLIFYKSLGGTTPVPYLAHLSHQAKGRATKVPSLVLKN